MTEPDADKGVKPHEDVIEALRPVPDDFKWLAPEAAHLVRNRLGPHTEPCGNCGAIGAELVPCLDVWSEAHTHPVSATDLTPQLCSLALCGRCARRVERNIARAALDGTGQ